MDKPFTILPDAPAMPGAKASPFYVQKEKKGEQKSYRTITHWHDELECLTILDGTLDFQLNEFRYFPAEGFDADCPSGSDPQEPDEAGGYSLHAHPGQSCAFDGK